MIVPPVKHDLKLMSIGFFLDDNAPVMWRGPMLHRALEQFLSDVHWGELDLLLVDMPPGTGDVSISLGQLLPRAEAVIVTTPQPLAQEVAARAATDGAEDEHAPDRRDREHDLRGVRHRRRGARWPRRSASPLLGMVPLDPRLRECGDEGEPLVVVRPGVADARGRSSRSPRRSTPARQTFKALPVLVLTDAEVERGSARSASPRPTRARSPTTSSTPSGAARRATGSRASTGWRRCPASTRPRGPSGVVAEPGYERWDGNGALGYLTLAAICDAQLADPPATRACRRRRALLPDRRARLLGAPARRRRPRRRADRDLAAAARLTRTAAQPLAGTNPLAIGDPELGRTAARRRRLDGHASPTATCSPARPRPRSSSRSAATRRTRRSRSRSAWRCWSARCAGERARRRAARRAAGARPGARAPRARRRRPATR